MFPFKNRFFLRHHRRSKGQVHIVRLPRLTEPSLVCSNTVPSVKPVLKHPETAALVHKPYTRLNDAPKRCFSLRGSGSFEMRYLQCKTTACSVQPLTVGNKKVDTPAHFLLEQLRHHKHSCNKSFTLHYVHGHTSSSVAHGARYSSWGYSTGLSHQATAIVPNCPHFTEV